MATETTNTNIDITDVQAIKDLLGIDIRALAKQAKKVAANKDQYTKEKTEAKKNTEKPKPEKTFSLVMALYPDFAIEKKTKSKTQRLVIMPSVNSYFVETTEGTGKGEILTLTKDIYSAFSTGMEEDIDLPEGFWVDHVSRGTVWYNCVFEEYLQNPTIIEMVKNKIAPQCDTKKLRSWETRNYLAHAKAYNLCPKAYKIALGNTALIDFIVNKKFSQVVKKFGEQNAVDFLEEAKNSLANLATLRPYIDLVDDSIEMEYKKYKEYVLYQSVRMGYGETMSAFYDEWYDYLRMQNTVYQKIKEKYPDNLPTAHHIMMYKRNIIRQEGNKVLFERQYEINKQYEAKVGPYMFMAPKTRQDMLDEATMQANCVAFYSDRYAEGSSKIFFMRLAKEPEQSVVTIEVRDGEVRQAYEARNRHISSEEEYYINQWCKKTEVAKEPYPQCKYKPIKEETKTTEEEN